MVTPSVDSRTFPLVMSKIKGKREGRWSCRPMVAPIPERGKKGERRMCSLKTGAVSRTLPPDGRGEPPGHFGDKGFIDMIVERMGNPRERVLGDVKHPWASFFIGWSIPFMVLGSREEATRRGGGKGETSLLRLSFFLLFALFSTVMSRGRGCYGSFPMFHERLY